MLDTVLDACLAVLGIAGSIVALLWFVLSGRLFYLLRHRYPDIYDALDRPSFLTRGKVTNYTALKRLASKEEFQFPDDPSVTRLVGITSLLNRIVWAGIILLIVCGWKHL